MITGAYFVTGKLGTGKTLIAVSKIQERLYKNLPVATNLDLNLEHLINWDSKQCRVYRLPDKPTVEDMKALGYGNTSYDDSQNGLIVLDELGTWFNSRTWNDKSRSEIIDWCLHARKLGWDLIFIVQDIKIIDKQLREALAEHVVYCRRLDRLKWPLIDTFLNYGGLRHLKPKMHMGIVKYGDQPTSLIVDRWYYTGRSLYKAYDTKQIFKYDYDHGIYQYLPPFYVVKGRATRNGAFYMKLTKIYFRKYSRIIVAAVGFVAGTVLAISQRPEPQVIEKVIEQPGKPTSQQQEINNQVEPVNPFEGQGIDPVGVEYSETWRIAGDINELYLLESENHTRYVPKSACSQFVATKDDFCVIQGRVVTRWTGPSVNRPVFAQVQPQENTSL